MKYSKNFAHQHANGKSTWHFEWCTKYRYNVFMKEYNKNLCTIALIEAAKKANAVISEMEVQPNHIHMIVELPLTVAPITAIKTLKSISARILFAALPKLRLRYPKNNLWSREKFAMSVGNITLEKAKEYVKNQETHHAEFLLTRRILARSEAEGSTRRVEGLPRGGGQKFHQKLSNKFFLEGLVSFSVNAFSKRVQLM